MGTNQPLVSVIIPTYNRKSHLQDTLDSVLDQEYDNIEVIIIDDNSEKSMKDIVENKLEGSRFKYKFFRHSVNKGQNAARNTGIRKSSGEFIALLDDDDIWEPSKVKRQINCFQRNEDNIGVVYVGQKFVNNKGEVTSTYIRDIEGDVTKQILSGKSIAPTSSVMVRTNIVEKAGLPDENCPTWTDKEWYIRLSIYCEFKSISKPLVIRRTDADNQMSKQYELKRDESYEYFINKYADFASKYGIRYKYKFMSHMAYLVARSAISANEYSDARKYSIKSITSYPLNIRPYPLFLVSIGGEGITKHVIRIKRKYEKFKLGRYQ